MIKYFTEVLLKSTMTDFFFFSLFLLCHLILFFQAFFIWECKDHLIQDVFLPSLNAFVISLTLSSDSWYEVSQHVSALLSLSLSKLLFISIKKKDHSSFTDMSADCNWFSVLSSLFYHSHLHHCFHHCSLSFQSVINELHVILIQ